MFYNYEKISEAKTVCHILHKGEGRAVNWYPRGPTRARHKPGFIESSQVWEVGANGLIVQKTISEETEIHNGSGSPLMAFSG